MEELKRKRITKANKEMDVILVPHIRALVNRVNSLKIPKEDIVTVMDKGDEIILIYYRQQEIN